MLDRPFYDLGSAQFAEIVPRKGDGAYSWPEYVGRTIMLARRRLHRHLRPGVQ